MGDARPVFLGELMQVREHGVIKFVSEKGFGFIGRIGGPDVFVHVSEFEPGAAKLIQPGVRVEFDIEMDSRGRLRATAVTLVANGA